MALEILKDSKLKQLLEEHSGKEQSAQEARDRLDQMVLELLVKIAKAAGESADKANLTRLMPENIEDGFNKVLNQSNVAPDPKMFLNALNAMDVKQLGEVLRYIADWTHESTSAARRPR